MRSSKTVTIYNVGTEWVETAITNLPDKLIFKRSQVLILSGIGTQVALQVREKVGSIEPTDIPLEYDLVESLDYLEDALVIPYKRRDKDLGSLWVAVRCDVGINVVKVVMEFES